MRFHLRPMMHYLAFVHGSDIHSMEECIKLTFNANNLMQDQNSAEGFKKWNTLYNGD